MKNHFLAESHREEICKESSVTLCLGGKAFSSGIDHRKNAHRGGTCIMLPVSWFVDLP
jgi:hypothetical protein